MSGVKQPTELAPQADLDAQLIGDYMAELDARIDGKRGTPPALRAYLAAARPFLREGADRDPKRFAQVIRDFLAELEARR